MGYFNFKLPRTTLQNLKYKGRANRGIKQYKASLQTIRSRFCSPFTRELHMLPRFNIIALTIGELYFNSSSFARFTLVERTFKLDILSSLGAIVLTIFPVTPALFACRAIFLAVLQQDQTWIVRENSSDSATARHSPSMRIFP